MKANRYIQAPIARLLNQPKWIAKTSGGSVPLILDAIGDNAVLQQTQAGADNITSAENFVQTQITGLNTEIVAIGFFRGPTVSQAIDGTLDGQAMTRLSESSATGAFPGAFIYRLSPGADINGPLNITFDQSDITEMGAFVFAFRTDGTDRVGTTAGEGSPPWDITFPNTNDADLLGVSGCVVDDNDVTIGPLTLDQTVFGNISFLTDEITTGSIRWRIAAHRNQPASHRHRWEGGESGDDSRIALYESLVV